MTLRPIPARWFELVTVHSDLAKAMESLSRTGAVELEARRGPTERLPLSGLDEQVRGIQERMARYKAYCPAAASEGVRRSERLAEMLDRAHRHVAAWSEQADPIVASLERRSREAADLEQLREALTHAGAELPDLRRLARAGPRLQARLLMLPAGKMLYGLSAPLLLHHWRSPSADYLLAVGRPVAIGELETQLPAGGRVVPLPPWLPSSVAESLSNISKRLVDLAKEKETLNGELAALSERSQIARALGDIALIGWLDRYAKELGASARLAWITGWTSDLQGTALRRALDAQGVRYVLRLSDAPIGADAPMLMSNPPFARMFETFTRLLGVPARHEADPSLVLAVIAPLIFGFMFADIGQGLVILVAGLALGKRNAILWMLAPGGIMAVGFGVLFGSVFCREDLIPALWIRPLDEPVTLLIASIVSGVVVLSVGMALDALQEYWRAGAQSWWLRRVGLPIAYFGLLISPIAPSGLILAALGAGWHILGSAMLASERKLVAMARAAAEFGERILQLLVNTVSFSRVGAFALAHAGLSATVVGLAEASGPVGYWFALALGNALVIALEGLVVSIQATRLMLFEFFIRFLSAGGRVFKTLPPPESVRKIFAAAAGGVP